MKEKTFMDWQQDSIHIDFMENTFMGDSQLVKIFSLASCLLYILIPGSRAVCMLLEFSELQIYTRAVCRGQTSIVLRLHSQALHFECS